MRGASLICGVMLRDRADCRSSSSRTKIHPICSGFQLSLIQGQAWEMNWERAVGRASTSDTVPNIFMGLPMRLLFARKEVVVNDRLE